MGWGLDWDWIRGDNEEVEGEVYILYSTQLVLSYLKINE
jgi:hypothetical protein